MRLIDADALKKVITEKKYPRVCEDYIHGYNDGLNEILDLIGNAPTIEPSFGVFKSICCEDCDKNTKPHGKWISKDKVDGHMFGYSCSNCRNPEWQIKRFCPNCGAKMDGGEEE